MVSRKLPPPPKKIAVLLGLRFGSRLGLVLGLGGNHAIASEENCPPIRVGVWVRISFGARGQFSSGAIINDIWLKIKSQIILEI